jgi:hypothetical protein
MTLRSFAWWSGGVWGGIGLTLLLLYVAAELFGAPQRSWRQRIIDVLVHLPLVLPIALFGWPFLLVVAFFQIRRDLILERACYGGTLSASRPTSERHWLHGRDATRLLVGLASEISPRKQRLFACACCRRIWDRLGDERSRTAVEVAERFADGEASQDEADDAGSEAGQVAGMLMSQGELEAGAAARACQDCLSGDALGAAIRTSVSAFRKRHRERRAQCDILREIVGNPFHPLRPRYFPPEVVELARACHDGDHALYPLLADALDELGEPAAAEHCRQAGHLRGCHVVTWVLGWE